MRDSN